MFQALTEALFSGDIMVVVMLVGTLIALVAFERNRVRKAKWRRDHDRMRDLLNPPS